MGRILACAAAPAALLAAVSALPVHSAAAAPVSPGGGLSGLIAASPAASNAVSPPTSPSLGASASSSSSSAATQEARALVNEATGGEFAEGNGGVVTTLGELRVETPDEDVCQTKGGAEGPEATQRPPHRPSAPLAQTPCAPGALRAGRGEGEVRDETGAILAAWPS